MPGGNCVGRVYYWYDRKRPCPPWTTQICVSFIRVFRAMNGDNCVVLRSRGVRSVSTAGCSMPSGEPPAVRSRDRVAVVQKRRCRRLAAAGRRRMVLAPRLAYLEVTSGRGHHPGRVGSRCPTRARLRHRAEQRRWQPAGVRYGWAVRRGCHTGESELARPFRGTLRVPFGRRRSDRPLKLPDTVMSSLSACWKSARFGACRRARSNARSSVVSRETRCVRLSMERRSATSPARWRASLSVVSRSAT